MTARRLFVRLLLGAAALLVVLVILVLIALSSPAVAKRVIAFGLGKSPQGLEIGEIRGPLKGPLVLLGVKYRSGALSAQVDSVYFTWRPSRLLLGRVEFRQLHVTGLHITLPDSAPPDTAGTAPARRERPTAPWPIRLGDAVIHGIEIDAPGGLTFRSGVMRLAGNLEDYDFDLTGDAFAPQVRAVRMHLSGRGSLAAVRLDSSTVEMLKGRIAATGTVAWWPELRWDLAARADSVQPDLLLQTAGAWPGRVSLVGTTKGVMDSSGPAGRARIDSVWGALRGQPLSGHADVGFAPEAYDLADVDLRWGSAKLKLQGIVHDTVSVRYELAIADLRTATRRTRGTLTLEGTASGQRLAPRFRAKFESRNLASGPNRVQHLRGTADIDLAHNGRNDLELRAERAQTGRTKFERLSLSLHGTHSAHSLLVDGGDHGDSLHLRLAGAFGRGARSWRGRLNELAVRTERLGGWRLEQPAQLAATRQAGQTTLGSARVGALCVAADSGAGRVCGSGDWRGTRTWNVSATLERLPVTRLAGAGWSLRPGQQSRLSGTIHAQLDAHSLRGRVTGTLRAATDTVVLVYQQGRDAKEHRLALDSAVVNVTSDQQGMLATLGMLVRDERNTEVLTLTGSARLPEYRGGLRFANQPLSLTVDGKVPDVRYAEAFVGGVDSLRGGLVLALSGSGTAGAPELKGALTGTNLVAGLPGRRVASGAAVLAVDGGVAANGALNGTLTLTPSAAHWDYRYFGEDRRIVLDSGTVLLKAGADGVRGTLGLGASDLKGKGIASLAAEVSLPNYTNLHQRLSPQVVGSRVRVDIPDLSVLQPLMIYLDSVGGRMQLQLALEGHLNAPIVTGELQVEQGRGRLEYGTVVRGGLTANLDAAVTSDNTLTGSLRVAPREVTFSYPVGSGSTLARLQGRGLEFRSLGPAGTQGTLDLAFADSAGATMGTLEGRAALPQLTRLGQSLAAQPVEATLAGRVADLAFLEAFTSHVDSAAGRLSLDASLRGTMSDSHLTGNFDVKEVALRMPPYGILVHDIQFTGRGDSDGSIRVDGKMRSGPGELTIAGTTPSEPTSANPGRLRIRGDHFEVMNNNELHALVSPRLEVRLASDSIDLSGDIDLPLARLMLSQVPVSAVAPSDDIIYVDSVKVRDRPVSAQLRITLGDSVSFSGFNFNAELGGMIQLDQVPGRMPTATGTLRIEEGSYKAYGQDLKIKDGEIRFSGGPVNNPVIALQATRVLAGTGASDSVIAGIDIRGNLKDPQVSLFSQPPMSQTQILSYILTGSPVGGGTGAEGNFFNKALSSLGLKGGNLLARSVGHQLGLAEATLQTESDVKHTSLRIGRFLTPSLYVSYGMGLFDPVSTLRLRYVLSNHITLMAEAGQVTSGDALIKIEPGKKKEP